MMTYSTMIVTCIVIVVVVGFALRPILKGKSNIEIITFSILLVVSGFSLYYIDSNNFVGLTGLGLIFIGLFTGVLSFVAKKN